MLGVYAQIPKVKQKQRLNCDVWFFDGICFELSRRSMFEKRFRALKSLFLFYEFRVSDQNKT